MRSVQATRYVTPLREGGSLPALMEADDNGIYVVKFRGAGHGPRTLVAEWVVGEIARKLGLNVPELVEIHLDEAIGKAEADPEIQHIVVGSAGSNIGLDYLPGSVTFSPAADTPPSAEDCARIVWLDTFTTNIDRMVQNPNMLMWHKNLWLIDHGAALYVHAAWRGVEDNAKQGFEMIKDHVLLPYAESISKAHDFAQQIITQELIDGLLQEAPDSWFNQDALGRPAQEVRAAYSQWFGLRLEAADIWVEAAENARKGLLK